MKKWKKIKEVSEMDNQRRLRREREKKRRRKGWICLITYSTIISFITGGYLIQNQNLFFQILLSIIFVILLTVGYYLSYKIFFKKKKTRISYGRRYY